MSGFRVTNDRSPNGGDQEFKEEREANRYARVLNDRYPDAHARVVPVRRSVTGHVPHLRVIRMGVDSTLDWDAIETAEAKELREMEG